MAQGAIQHAVDRGSEVIKPPNEAIAAQAREAKANYLDETAWYQHEVLAWRGCAALGREHLLQRF
jgi:hypothetical protein